MEGLSKVNFLFYFFKETVKQNCHFHTFQVILKKKINHSKHVVSILPGLAIDLVKITPVGQIFPQNYGTNYFTAFIFVIVCQGYFYGSFVLILKFMSMLSYLGEIMKM